MMGGNPVNVLDRMLIATKRVAAGSRDPKEIGLALTGPDLLDIIERTVKILKDSRFDIYEDPLIASDVCKEVFREMEYFSRTCLKKTNIVRKQMGNFEIPIEEIWREL